jgi:putative phosphoesterase
VLSPRAQGAEPAAGRRSIRIGVISDTHGLLRREAIAALRRVHLIVHAGDIGAPEILAQLSALAPTLAVRGNVDRQAWAAELPTVASVRVGEARLWILHDIAELEADLPAAGFAAVIYGHSHRPQITVRDRVVFVNPGSAGPRRFRLPVSLAHVHVRGRGLRAEIVTLDV